MEIARPARSKQQRRHRSRKLRPPADHLYENVSAFSENSKINKNIENSCKQHEPTRKRKCCNRPNSDSENVNGDDIAIKKTGEIFRFRQELVRRNGEKSEEITRRSLCYSPAPSKPIFEMSTISPTFSATYKSLRHCQQHQTLESDADCVYFKSESHCDNYVTMFCRCEDSSTHNTAFVSSECGTCVSFREESSCVPLLPDDVSERIRQVALCEQQFVDNVNEGVQLLSRPLRHLLLTAGQHTTLFQNIEKVCLQCLLAY